MKIILDLTENDIIIEEGEFYILDENIPHRPEREDHSIGIVIESARRDEQSGKAWRNISSKC